ncbi:hypothetical protein DLAC_05993 [Tieghemostelium lacteum]|uniref:N-acetyltransferase domain-containing protein n=1 Tax=Tieghemostelium lacteum TaxID=361077 RepID=A0A151ZHD9_TIELA|nr:hypothetical protein DLAC_05993 [Tieghemostelium lacteum]|eukprot:KYQ93325.1 hypothetical protein DLAC_05993 [Tieghemostelium lacteum]
MESYKYEVLNHNEITLNRLNEISELFTNSYAVWGKETGDKYMKKIRFSPLGIQENCLYDNTCKAALAYDGNKLIGHSLFTTIPNENNSSATGNNDVIFISQLVVDKDYRAKNISKELIRKSISDTWSAIGIVTAHPYSVKSLEKTVGIDCDMKLIAKYARDLVYRCTIPFIKNSALECTETQSLINTNFPADHSEVLEILKTLVNNRKWNLNPNLPESYEFFAFVFREQQKIGKPSL